MVTSLISMEGETLELRNCICRSNEVEDIMKQIGENMVSNLRNIMRKSYLEFENYDKKKWILINCC